MMRIYVLMTLTMIVAAGCSVKEDRMNCPCMLVLDFADVDTSVVSVLNLLATLHGEVVLDERVDAVSFGKEYVCRVPHGHLQVNVWAGGEGREGPSGVVIPYGCECPPIFMDSFIADTRGDVFRKVVTMHKNHCRLTIEMDGVEEIPYSLTFKGQVDGYGLDGMPQEGDFSCVAYPGLKGESHALLPRQLDSSLMLEVDDGTSVAKTFAIGEYIVSSGYDWSAVDLEDVTLMLDYYITYIKIEIQGWDKEYVYNVTL